MIEAIKAIAIVSSIIITASVIFGVIFWLVEGRYADENRRRQEEYRALEAKLTEIMTRGWARLD